MTSPCIVAEVSCNHLGRFDRALDLIDAAKRAGADAVKFQCWASGLMCLDSEFVPHGTPWDRRTLKSLYRDAWTPWPWFPRLFSYAKEIGIECFASVFDHESLRFLEGLGCPRYKIASFEITDLPLIEAVAKTGKPIVISTGMATFAEIELAFRATGRRIDVTLLKCTSTYPASNADANLTTLAALAMWGSCGISDHTLGLVVPVAATALGATMIEKHLTLCRAAGGPDAAFSSEPHEFRAMVDACREAALALGTVSYGPTEAEKPSLQFRRSLYWVADLPVGTYVRPEHIRTARPSLGDPPSVLPQLLWRRLLRDVKYGEPAFVKDVE